MATLKYKTPEGEWKKVSIGGGGSTEEVYVGSDAPTDENVKVWIDPTGTPSQPSQPSAGVEVIDNLDSEDTTAALSANQGRVLKEMIEELPSGEGGGAKIYQLPSGLFDSSFDNLYYFTAEEQQSLVDAIMSANSMFFISIFDTATYKIFNVPLILEFDQMFKFSGNKVKTTTTASGSLRLTMTIWEIYILPTDGAYMKVTEQVIYEA
jgi:hypothetical protein